MLGFPSGPTRRSTRPCFQIPRYLVTHLAHPTGVRYLAISNANDTIHRRFESSVESTASFPLGMTNCNDGSEQTDRGVLYSGTMHRLGSDLVIATRHRIFGLVAGLPRLRGVAVEFRSRENH